MYIVDFVIRQLSPNGSLFGSTRLSTVRPVTRHYRELVRHADAAIDLCSRRCLSK